MRYKLTIEYDGSFFHGWQKQDNALSVQEVLERAIFKYSGEKVTAFCGGRTDAGVHETGQVAHIDFERGDSPFTMMNAINYHILPHPVSVVAIEEASDEFHARFDAIGRCYQYRIKNQRARLALDRGRAWWYAKPLDVAAMAEGASYLIGHHDFTSFRAKNCQAKTAEKTLSRLDITQNGSEIVFNVAARSFLYHQVRNMVGSLVKVGNGAWVPTKIADVLQACDRSVAGPTAPAEGLYLTAILYEEGAL